MGSTAALLWLTHAMSALRVVVLGAGFGGLELTSLLSAEFGDQIDIVLVDQRDGFVFGFSKLDVMFGRTTADAVVHPYRDIVKPGVRFVKASILGIDPVAKRVETDAGTFDGDILVVALGANLHPELTPGLVEGGHEFYTNAGAFAVRDVLDAFQGGRVVVGVTSTPFKCPPAPSETALLTHAYLTDRGLRDASSIALVMPLPVPIPPSPAASEMLLATFAERGIEWHGDTLITAIDPSRKVALLEGGGEMPFDLFLGVPVHRAPSVVVEAGLTEDGWIPVDFATLATTFPGVYAVGDVTSVGTPKAGVFAQAQAVVVANEISAIVRGVDPSVQFDGFGYCYLEMGHDEVARVAVTFPKGEAPYGTLDDPSPEILAAKATFGSSRVARWFDRSS